MIARLPLPSKGQWLSDVYLNRDVSNKNKIEG
jgi:hypothetical protein